MNEKQTLHELVAMNKPIKGVSFVSAVVRNSKTGEVARHTLNVGIKHRTLQERDLAKYINGKEKVFKAFAGLYPDEMIRAVYEKKLGSLQASLAGVNARSNSANDAFVYIAPGLAYCPTTEDYYLSGYSVNKTVLERGEYKPVKHKPETILGSKMEALLKVKAIRARKMKVSGTMTYTTGGRTLKLQ